MDFFTLGKESPVSSPCFSEPGGQGQGEDGAMVMSGTGKKAQEWWELWIPEGNS